MALGIGGGILLAEQKPRRIEDVPAQPSASTLRSLARLVVGGVLLGLELLEQRLPEWEQEATRRSADRGPAPTAPAEGAGKALPSRLPQAPSARRRDARGSRRSGSPTRLRRAATTLRRCERTAWQLTTPVRRPLAGWRIFAPARRRFAELEARGQGEVDRWLERSRTEARHSRALARVALEETVERSLEELAHNPDIRDLVLEQSTGLAGDVIEEVRERSASADTLVEGWVRRLLMRPPRKSPQEPPADLPAAVSPPGARHRRGTRG